MPRKAEPVSGRRLLGSTGMLRADAFPRFVPRAPWWGPDLQTLRNTLRGPVAVRPEGTRTERLTLALRDGSGDRLSALLERPRETRPDAPLVVVIHGLGGDETSAYVQATAAALLASGYPVLRLNLRGAGPSRPLCRQQYHAGRTGDLRDALLALPGSESLVVVGYSLAGNMLLKFLAEHGAEVPRLLGAVAVSAPIDLARSSARILEARNWAYHRHLLAGMKREALAASSLTDEEHGILREVRTIVEFDERIVAPRNGFAGAEDYYARNHARRFLAEIRIETLVIHALDDPWIPGRLYTDFDWSTNPRLVPLLPAGGGHVGFHAADARTPWHDRCVLRFVARLTGAEEAEERAEPDAA